MTDLAPTILQQFELPTDPYSGVPLQRLAADCVREVVFQHHNENDSDKAPNQLAEFALESGRWHLRRNLRIED